MNIFEKLRFYLLNPRDYKRVLKAYQLLLRQNNLSRDDLESLQQQKLKSLINHAQSTVPYWKKVLQNIDVPISRAEDIDSLPILTKNIARDEKSNMWSEMEKEFIVATTGGTTGHPLTIRRDLEGNALTKAALWRGRFNWGVKPSDKTVYLIAFGKGSFLGKLRMRLSNKLIGDAFPSSEDEVNQIVNMISGFKPKAVEGFATGLLASANRVGDKLKTPVPVIISTGEMLYAHQRKTLEEKFNGKVYTYYGCNEVGSIAYECEHQKLHVNEDHVILETVNEKGEPVINEPGSVLVTDLDNKAMPFIRYEIGDVAVLSDEPCSCGRPNKVIAELQGRTQDFLTGSENRTLQATQLSGFLKDLMETGQLQFIQHPNGEVEVLHDKLTEKTKEELQVIESHLHARLGQDLIIKTTHVNRIERTARGKQPLVVRAKK